MGINPVSISKTAFSSFPAGIVSAGVKQVSCNESVPTINLLRFLKKGLHDYDQIDGILHKLPDEKKSLGCLPDMWRKMFVPPELPQKTKDFHNIFREFAKNFQQAEGSSSKTELTLQNLAKKLGSVLKSDTDVSYVDSGMFGSVVRIKGGKEDLALKIFHEIPETTEPLLMPVYKRHGQTMEIQNAIALNHGLKPSQRARFYMGRITSLGEDGGYILSEFVNIPNISKAHCKPYSPIEDFTYSRFFMNDTLKKDNMINGKLIDFGDVSYRFPNKEQEKIAKEIFPLICKGDTKELVARKESYKGNPEFDAVVKNSTAEIVRHLSYPFNLISFMEAKGAKEVLSSMNALGVDFSELKAYKYFKPEQTNFLKSVGIIQ